MIRAAQISGTAEFVKKHPRGYEMPIGERGQGLSGGQRQSIGIARAFLLNAPIMLLDEPSNAMDQLTEANLIQNMQTALKDTTSLLITQKMTLLALVERVIVMHEGRIIIDAPKESALAQLQGGGKKIEKK